MSNARMLPVTGTAGMTVAGIYFNQLWLVAVAVSLVAIGTLLVRFSWRKGRTVADR